MEIRDESIFSVNVVIVLKSCKNDICWCKFWCDVKQQEIKELVD